MIAIGHTSHTFCPFTSSHFFLSFDNSQARASRKARSLYRLLLEAGEGIEPSQPGL